MIMRLVYLPMRNKQRGVVISSSLLQYLQQRVVRTPHAEYYQSRISRAERLFNYDVIDSHAVSCNSNKQNDPIDDALRGHHALTSLRAGI